MGEATVPENLLNWVMNLVYLVIVVGTTFGLITAFIVTTVKVADTESHILLNRLQFSPEGIVKYDKETGRAYPGIVEIGRLNDGVVESGLNIGERELAARLELFATPEDSLLATAYLHKEVYDDWQPIAIVVAEGGIEGVARKFPHEEARYVYSGSAAKLETVVITPNE